MTIKIHDLQPVPGSNKRKKRVGRGTKGQKARNTVPMGFEGGQMPLYMRVPKRRGFNNPFRVEYQAINLDTIEESGLDEISPSTLQAKGLAHKGALVKILGRGEVSSALNVKAHKFSASAAQAIEAAGGSVETRPLPWGDRRPPAKGNQFTNR